MKQNTRKLVPAIAMLVVAAVTLTSASYAWFTMSREVSADGIQLTATAPNNLLIASGSTGWSDAATAGTYDSKVTLGILSKDASGANVSKLMPVSSADGLAMVAVEKITNSSGLANKDAVAITDPAKVPAVTASKDGYYLDIPLWIKSTGGSPVDVAIDATNSKIEMVGTDKPLYLAARFSVLDRTDATLKAFTGGDGWIFSTGTRTYLSAPADDASAVIGPMTGTEVAGSVWKGTKEVTSNFTIGGKANNKLFTIPASSDPKDGQVQKIMVRVWLEGQDARCITDNSSQSFKITVAFKDASLNPTTEATTTAP